ncbi:TetR/AcrR family transcriptional regulator [Actinospongicola halichondriae]|uniref:TetR/AcrR family transcriptional regulator n=1 Tax=Actinospongicola halichondriae TaxID=3236844 RepID=UPI003D4D2C6B
MGVNQRENRRPSRAERRVQLLDAAVEAIRTKGAGASMEQLAKQGGVTKPILYRHFGDRDGLVDAIGERYAAHLVERLTPNLESDEPIELLRQTVDSYLAFLEDDPELYTFLIHQGPRTATRSEDRPMSSLTDVIARQVAVVIGDQLRANDLDAGGSEPMAFGIVGMVHHAGDWWIRNRTMSRTAVTDYLTTILWNGFSGLREATTAATAAAGTPGGTPDAALH